MEFRLPLGDAEEMGETEERITGAKAPFCFTAVIMLAGEKLKMPGVTPQLDSDVVGEDDKTCNRKDKCRQCTLF